MGPDVPLKKKSNDRQNLSTINESATKFTEANLTKINPIIDKTLLPDPHPGKIVPTESSILNCNPQNNGVPVGLQKCSPQNNGGPVGLQKCSPQNNGGPAGLQKCSPQNNGVLAGLQKCSPQNNGVPAGLQTDFINRWTEVITQKVIAEFSKDVNATLNSFSLADKVNGCGIKDIAKGLNVEDDINLINVCQNIQKSSQDIAKLLASSTAASESDHSNTVTVHEQIPTNSKPTVQKLEIEKELSSYTNNSAPTVPPEENHKKFHTGEKGFDCSHCPERFELRKDLKDHIATVHKDKEDTTSRGRRNSAKSFNGTYKDIMDDDDEEEITSEEESKDNSDEEMDKVDAYSDMIMHIATDIDGSPESRQFGTEETDNSTDMLEFVNASQDYADNFTDTDIKTEPIGFNELKSRLGDNKYINFDPSIVKVEPEEIIDESALAENHVVSSRVNVEFNTSVVKCEPLNS
ncbi:Hypothetical predicted protein [Mytilus galloprovincialis]|uniref:C2H2-type domain-containing protein n=1 Tax=Mytilus galloprovincialis TaxID=29158 RepID=A0A8B6GLE8_MYTGA|nr:Hypothetical predicted protein [Mytilus galloprovincialis]